MAFLAVTTCACGAVEGSSNFSDGGRATDGGKNTDGGAAEGSSSSSDGGTATDGGRATDGGKNTDGGSAAGGGSSADAGSAPDGGPASRPNNGNPFLPGYFADPSVFYDADNKTFYVFATTDGNWIGYSAEPTVWYSTDFVHWKSQSLTLPSIWPKQPLWAPSIMKHPTNGRYFLLYAIGSQGTTGTYIAQSTSPLGPWTNATAGTTTATAPIYKVGEMWGSNDWFDAQFFVDGDVVYMTFGGGGGCGIAKLAFSAEFLASIDNTDSRMTDGTLHKFRRLTGLSNYLEGAVMFKNGGRYFITYSSSACQNYNVQYVVGPSPLGPFTHGSGAILQRDNAKNVLGPGHNSILQYENDWYIVYHRQHFPYVDVKRQVSIDRIVVSGDAISAGVQTREGVFAGPGALEALVRSPSLAGEPDLAFEKAVVASSESDYKGGVSGNIKETFPVMKGFYSARSAVDHSYGTRWSPTTLPATLTVDLGADRSIGRCETTFEYVVRPYRYRIEYLTNTEASSLATAQQSTAWHIYADRSANTTRLSPIVDVATATARYLKVSLLSAELPTAQGEISTILETDYADRVSIVEFQVFQNASPP